MKTAILLGGAVFLLAACKSSDKPYQAATPQPTHSESAPTPPTPPADTSTPAASSTLSFSAVPQSLRNDAFTYYGLSSPREKTYKSTSNSSGSDSQQVSSLTLDKMDDGKIEFTEKDTGFPSTEQSMSLDSTGLYVESIKPQTLTTPHLLEFPAKLSVGTHWTSHQAIQTGGQTLDQNLTFNVVGTKPIKTPAGTFQALYIVGTGTGTQGGKTAATKAESWYAKDVGLVKQVLTIDESGSRMTMQQILIKQ